MGKAARAIIIENGQLLVMHRDKLGSSYYTLVGGRVNDDEDVQHALVREVKEETGLDVTSARYVLYEHHVDPYNEQYVFLCTVAPFDKVEIQKTSEEALMNKYGFNTHRPYWVSIKAFSQLAFRTPLLHQAIIRCLDKGFPDQPTQVN